MSSQVDVDKVLAELKAIAAKATNEEEFKINAERVLYNEVLSKLNLQPGKYEYTFVSGGRSDALYGHLLIEYKAPGKLSKEAEVAKAKEQLIGYIKKEAEVEERYKLFLGVILCDKIAFVRYDVKNKDWTLRGPYELNRETVLRLIEAIRGLRRKRLAVDELLNDFGPKSEIARRAVKEFYDKIVKTKSSKAKALFNDWTRLFSQACAYSPKKLRGLGADYGISGRVDYNVLLFSIHTYYALIMKLLGAEVAYLYGAGKWLKSYVSELEDAHMRSLDALRTALEELESGGIFRKLLNITNFVEGDYFSWYLEELDKKFADIISDIAKKLAEYEPATPVLEPEYTRDLLKKLYQNLVPKKIRHNLGEYYTPDWLGELVLNEVGLTVENLEKLAQEKKDPTAPLNLRVLDPACGSGTFLILTIKRFREYAEEHYLRDVLAKYLLKNIIGFDLNPLAILAARTNYLLAIADLLSYVKGYIEIPIYLSDSLVVEEKNTLMSKTYVIRTYVGEFQIPQSIVERGLLGRLLETVDRYLRLMYKPEDFEQVVVKELNLDESELRLVNNLYKTFLKLEKEGKNHVWTSIIKNVFAPLTIVSSQGKFDYVVGNPPWINWESLPETYRENSRELWERYRLITKREGKVSLGKAKKDIAMLFVYVSIDRYLIDGGKLGFLITQTIFKSMAGEGFRNFWIAPEGPYFKVTEVHDLVSLAPFEGSAKNRTAVIFCIKGEKTDYPVPYLLWKGPKVNQELSLEEVLRLTSRINLEARPLVKRDGPWSTLPKEAQKLHKVIEKIAGTSAYRAFEGVNTALNEAYWVSILGETPDGNLAIENVTKGKVERFQTSLERKFVYPLLRGRDVERWKASSKLYIILPVDNKGNTIKIADLKTKYPKTYEFFQKFFDQLITRGGEPYKSQLKPWREKTKRITEKMPPFYKVFNAAPSLSMYKVIWREQASGLIAAVVGPIEDRYLGQTIVIPDHKLMIVPCNDEEEAHFICAFLNSCTAKLIAKSYIVETQISTHITQYVKIPVYEPKNHLHRKLSELSMKAHRLKLEGKEGELSKVEKEIDTIVAYLYGLSDEELEEITSSLAVLEGKGNEEEVEEEAREIKVEFLNAVVRPDVIGSFEVSVLNPLKEKIMIELQLPDRLVRIETDEEEGRIPVRTPRLEAGEYKILYKIITSKGVNEGEFTLYVREEEKHRVKEALSSKLDELLGE
jgi:methylase of polypeptide subunit release factors